MRKYTADFETIVDKEETRIWAYAICEIGDVENFTYGNNMEDFIKFCERKDENPIMYFHNLKFDSEFIISYLLNNEFTYIKDKKDRKDKTFTCLITSTGQFYSLEVYFTVKGKKVNKVTFYDSLKILNFSVSQIAKDFNLPIKKLEIDYKKNRKIGHELTDEEIAYIKNDVEIMARALKIMFDEDLTKMTIGADALSFYKSINKNFKHYFPILPFEVDEDIRKSYKGGFTYLNEEYKEKTTGEGVVLDVNSLYPSVMLNERLPFGEGIFFEGQYELDTLYPLYIQTISCSFEIKEGKIPTIQIKNNLSFIPNEYIKSSEGDIITLVLTNVDLELFLEHYNVDNLVYQGGRKFKCLKGLFTNYINFWSEKKISAKKENNDALYKISKLMLNSLYGKFGTNPIFQSKFPYLNDEGIVCYGVNEKELRNPVYIPIASFITSYARNKTIRTSQAIKDYTINKYGKDMYVYSDTDSIHTLLTNEEELKSFVDIDDYKLGAWKLESTFKRGRYLRQKCYIEEDYDGKLNVTVAGLPKQLGKYVTFENFNIGFSTENLQIDKEDYKLSYKHIRGGVVLVEVEYSIK